MCLPAPRNGFLWRRNRQIEDRKKIVFLEASYPIYECCVLLAISGLRTVSYGCLLLGLSVPSQGSPEASSCGNLRSCWIWAWYCRIFFFVCCVWLCPSNGERFFPALPSWDSFHSQSSNRVGTFFYFVLISLNIWLPTFLLYCLPSPVYFALFGTYNSIFFVTRWRRMFLDPHTKKNNYRPWNWRVAWCA